MNITPKRNWSYIEKQNLFWKKKKKGANNFPTKKKKEEENWEEKL